MDASPNRLRGVLLCLVSATAFGLGPLFAKEAYAAGTTVESMLLGRFVIAAAAFWVIVAVRATPVPRGRLLAASAVLGAVGYALQAMLYFGALTRIDATLAALLLYVYPALVVGLAVLLRREQVDGRVVLALVCSLTGLLLLLGGGLGGGRAATAGVIMALGAACTYAVYITLADQLLRGVSTFALSAVVCTSAALATGASGVVTGTLQAPSPAGMGWTALLAAVSTVIAVGCFFAGVRAIGAARAAVLSCAEPLVTAVAATVVHAEPVTAARVLGGAAVLAAVLIVQSRDLRGAARAKPLTPVAGPDARAEVGSAV